MFHMYSAERLEKKAEKILTEYKEGALLTAPLAMDVDDFAEFYCDAAIDFAYLSQDCKTLGCACFNDGVLMVWDNDRIKEIPLEVRKGYIFVDKALIDSEIEGRVRFTIIHECSHLILHPRFYYKKPGSVIPQIDCAVYQIETWPKRLPRTDEEVREWQANRLGAALIMPARTVKMLMAEKLKIDEVSLTAVNVSDIFIQGMADVFQVSKTAMRNRLRDLDLLPR